MESWRIYFANSEETRRKKEELRKITEAEEKAQSNAKPKIAAPKVSKASSSSSSSAKIPSVSAKIPDFNSGLEDEVTSYSASNIVSLLCTLRVLAYTFWRRIADSGIFRTTC